MAVTNIDPTVESDSERSVSRSPTPPPASPAENNVSRSESASPASYRSRSGSAQSNRSGSAGSEQRSRSASAASRPSASGSPRASVKSLSRSRSQSRSRSRSGSSVNASGSVTPQSIRSRSATPRSASASPRSNRSRSASSRSNRSRSGSPKSIGSRSGTPKSNRSRSGSPKSNRSRSGSPKSNRSRSGSPKSIGSRSGTPKSNRSRSGSPKSNRSRSGSPKSNRTRSASPTSQSPRSRSGTPKSSHRSGSVSSTKATVSPKSEKKRKRVILSDASGSDDDDGNSKKRSKSKVSEGESGGEDGNLVIDAGALFGDASDISDEDDGEKEKKQGEEEETEKTTTIGEEAQVEPEDEHERPNRDEDGGKENVAEEPAPETRIEVEIPKISKNVGKEIHFVKLPNFLSVETRPFAPETYEDEIDEEETLDEEGRARLKLKVENTIRWQEVVGASKTTRESNARFVRWSDGSMSLHLGSEIFDVYKQPLQGDHNHLFVRQGTGLQGQAVFRTKLSFRPHSTESFTHRKMTMSLADRSLKTCGIKMLSLVGKDPEAHRGELIKKEEERLRAKVRRESRQKRVREKGAGRHLSASYLEPDGDLDSDDDGISLNAIKKQHKTRGAAGKGDRPNIYSSDEDASDIETRRARRLDKAKAIRESDSEPESNTGP